MKAATIRTVRAILTAPEDIALVVVKVETSEPGLYGLGCATFTQRISAVKTAIDDYLGPWALGKDVDRIEDIWQSAMVSSYWRNGPVLNAALSGLDMALWDIKGKQAGMPCYQLWGGRSREAAAVYRHADGTDLEEIVDRVHAFVEAGYRHVRCQWGGYGGMSSSGTEPAFANPRVHRPDGAVDGSYFDPSEYRRRIPRLFARVREEFGHDIEVLHDVHERLIPSEAVKLAQAVDEFDLFFLEDLLAPEQAAWFDRVRQVSTVPLAMGELFTHPLEWLPLIERRAIDFVRMHISQIGGVTPALKVARVAESFGIQTAWHGPGDVSPVGHAANVHLDVHCPNFGIQEWGGWGEKSAEVFPGLPEVRRGYIYPNDKPGWGIDVDEAKAARYPVTIANPGWTLARTPDGTSVRP
ncbi:MAG: enolase C-terminal domain-like protein [Clostridia bacterium]